jgi:hypothetical protein
MGSDPKRNAHSAKAMDAAPMDPTWAFDAFRVAFPEAVERAFRSAYGAEHWEDMKHALATPYVCFSERLGRPRRTYP